MKEYVVYIEKIICSEHYLIAESADSAESIVLEYVLHDVKNQEITSNDYSEDVEVTVTSMSC